MTPPPKPEKVVTRNGKLVIVESPAKAKTVSRYLGKGYTVRASVGHVRDLLKSQLSVDIENNFAPKYRVPNEKKEVVKEIKKLAQKAEEVYLATDPDREGESISWHLLEAAQIDPERARRVVFHEITEPAIKEAFAHPRHINTDLVDAQQARRILDRLGAFTVSEDGQFAVIKTGGKQYRVAKDDVIVVEKLDGKAGGTVTFKDVLMVTDGKAVKFGTDASGATVTGKLIETKKGEKVTVFKKRRRNTYRRKIGHRQAESHVKITAIGGKEKE